MSQASSLGTQSMFRYFAAAYMGLVAVIMGGCEVDSYMDPSVVGRWEYTPAVLPILDRLDVIDEPDDRVPGLSEVRSEDLVPEIREYVMQPGDMITVSILDLLATGAEWQGMRQIDELGNIRLPIIGQVRAGGMTARQLEDQLVHILDPDVLRDPTVSVIVQQARQKTFSIHGVGGTGTYQIQENNFRLLDALALAGGAPEGVDHIHVIRQVPLSEVVEQGYHVDVDHPAHEPPLQPSRERQQQQADPQNDAEADPDDVDPDALIDDLLRGIDDEQDAPPAPQDEPATDGNGETQGQAQVEDAAPAQRQRSPLDQAVEGDQADGRFINVNGEWIWVEGDASEIEGDVVDGESGTLPPPDQMVTQRVIEIDRRALMRGEARHNIVVRPGDVIRVPPMGAGNIYIGGAIARPGVYSLPGEQKLTLTQAIIAAGGLDPLAIPERVDITRRLGTGQEAIVRLNVRAIFEGNQPNIYLKPDDTINVGTNLIAPFLAVTRNAFRMSYGFGFLLDRNFGTDVFGPVQRAGAGGF